MHRLSVGIRSLRLIWSAGKVEAETAESRDCDSRFSNFKSQI